MFPFGPKLVFHIIVRLSPLTLFQERPRRSSLQCIFWPSRVSLALAIAIAIATAAIEAEDTKTATAGVIVVTFATSPAATSMSASVAIVVYGANAGAVAMTGAVLKIIAKIVVRYHLVSLSPRALES